MTDVVIVEAGRSPIGKKKGSLAPAHPTEVLAQVIMEVLRRAGVEPGAVGQVVGGCIGKVGAQAMNVTRTAWLSAGGPVEVACRTRLAELGVRAVFAPGARSFPKSRTFCATSSEPGRRPLRTVRELTATTSSGRRARR